MGKFSSRANPHAIEERRVRIYVSLIPVKGGEAQFIKGTTGIALNGIQFRPNTAGSYDPTSKSGHGRNGDKSWTLDIFGTQNKLGLEMNNGHVSPGGL